MANVAAKSSLFITGLPSLLVSGASTPFGFWLDLLAGVRRARAIQGARCWGSRAAAQGPGKKLVEAIVRPEVNQAGEDIGEPSLGIKARWRLECLLFQSEQKVGGSTCAR
jgi:hypothetical protein